MRPLKCSVIFVFLLSLSSSLFTFISVADPKFLDNSCSENHFTRNSTYQSNINLLLSSLPSDANSSHKFSNATAGQDPDRVYGLFQCRGDISTTACQDCVALASTRATRLCPDQKGAIIWYDECLFRYSDSYIFSTAAHSPGIVPSNDTSVKREQRQFVEFVLRLINEAAIEAANDPEKFATRKGNSTASQPVYVLVQCTQDLSNTDCSGCLRESIAVLQSGRLGASSFKPSCNSRYESYLFYNENLTTLLPPQGKNQISSSLIKAIVAPITVFAALLFVGYCFLTRRARRKKYNTVPDEMAGNDIPSVQTLQFDFGTIEAATNRFSMDNKLGKGGFGEVYKVWKHWREETPLLLLDPTLTDSYSRNEVMRCIHIGLLCVQENPTARPTMATINLMLNNYSITLPLPKQPAFLLGKETELNKQNTSTSMPWSVDDASITEVYPR